MEGFVVLSTYIICSRKCFVCLNFIAVMTSYHFPCIPSFSRDQVPLWLQLSVRSYNHLFTTKVVTMIWNVQLLQVYSILVSNDVVVCSARLCNWLQTWQCVQELCVTHTSKMFRQMSFFTYHVILGQCLRTLTERTCNLFSWDCKP